MTLTHVDTLGGFQITLESLNVGSAKSTISCLLLPLFQMIFKKLKENICISRVFYTVPVIFLTLPIVDTFGGLKITLESLTDRKSVV